MNRSSDVAATAADSRTPAAFLVAATALWGATFVVIRGTVTRVDPTTLVFVRFGLASLPLLAALGVRRRLPARSALAGGSIAGLAAAAGYLFQAIGLQHTTAGTSAFLTSTGSVFAGILAWPLLGQRPGTLLLLGIGTATVGSALMAGPSIARLGVGEAWTLAGALAFGAHVVVLSRAAPAADPVDLAAVQSLVIAAVLAPAGIRHLDGGILAPEVLPRLAYLVVAGSLIAPLLQIVAQRGLSAGRAGLLLGLEPVFALVLAMTIGGERFGGRWWVGAALIVAGVAIVEARASTPARANDREGWPRSA